MTPRADCENCSWSTEDEDLLEVSDAAERHERKEHHDVDVARVATDGGDPRGSVHGGGAVGQDDESGTHGGPCPACGEPVDGMMTKHLRVECPDWGGGYEPELRADGSGADCGRRSCDRPGTVSYTTERGAGRRRCDHCALIDCVKGVSETRAAKILDEITLAELVEQCDGADGTHAPPRLSRINGLGPTTAAAIAANVDESPLPDAVDDEPVMTDGGTAHVNETGEGYLGVVRLDGYHCKVAVTTLPFQWAAGDEPLVVDDSNGLAVVDDSDGGDGLDHARVRAGDPGNDRLHVPARIVRKSLDVPPRADVRLYERDGRLRIVPADPDPMLVTDGGKTYGQLALERGRPTDRCGCGRCECYLHTYPEDDVCVWCRNGQHAVRADGGSKYTKATGDGYCGVARFSSGSVRFGVTMLPVDWEAETIVWATTESPGVALVTNEPADPITSYSVATGGLTTAGPSICITGNGLSPLDVDEGDDVRAYERDGGGLLLVAADPDPMLVADGGREHVEWYVVDESTATVVDGPFDRHGRASADAADRGDGFVAATQTALDILDDIAPSGLSWATDADDAVPVTDGGEVLYLTTLECRHGHERTFAYEGPNVPLDQSPPWPDVEYCPECAALYPDDLGVAMVEAANAERVDPEILADGGFRNGDRVTVLEDSGSPKAGETGEVRRQVGDHVVVAFDDGDEFGHAAAELVLEEQVRADGGLADVDDRAHVCEICDTSFDTVRELVHHDCVDGRDYRWAAREGSTDGG